jgi:hypothetical protein
LIGEVVKAYQSVNKGKNRVVWLSGILGTNDLKYLIDLVPEKLRNFDAVKDHNEIMEDHV